MNPDLVKKAIPAPVKRFLRRAANNLFDSYRYSRALKPPLSGEIRHVVFVCKGNICRSAFAEHYLKSRAVGSGLRIESCGLDVDQGRHSPPDAVAAAREFGIDLAPHRSKSMSECGIENADLILPMEYRHYLRLLALYPDRGSNIRLLNDFSRWPGRMVCNIHDPYGLPLPEFRRCFKRIRQTVDGLMNLQPGK